MKEIQAWLGHSNYNTIANLYAHLDTSSINNTGKVITSVFSTKKRSSPCLILLQNMYASNENQTRVFELKIIKSNFCRCY